jgi:stringent starvation protein B
MDKLPSTKPYLLRAIWEWCTDNGLTPHIAVAVDGNTRVPREFVRDGQIVLNVCSDATHKLNIGNDFIEFQARFGGVARDLSVPVGRVTAIYARENGAGMAFDLDADDRLAPPEALASTDEPSSPDQPPRPEGGRPKLQRIK